MAKDQHRTICQCDCSSISADIRLLCVCLQYYFDGAKINLSQQTNHPASITHTHTRIDGFSIIRIQCHVGCYYSFRQHCNERVYPPSNSLISTLK